MKNISKKEKVLTSLVILLAVIIIPFHYVFAVLPPIPPYQLLAPIPSIGPSIPVSDPTSLMVYINAVIPLFIGICAILAVIMIIVGGLQYMTSELISSKEAGKERIRNAIFGLLLALAAYLILKTINPDLLKMGPDLALLQDATVTGDVEYSSDNAILSDTGPLPSGPTMSCQEGIQRASNGTYVCGSMLQNFNNMVAAAAQAGCNLQGGGYRSVEQQKQTRINNCHGDYTSAHPNPPCHPPTALPGYSNHNNGKAVDFTNPAGTATLGTSDPCYQWLSQNASTYGYYNMPTEPWHWSVNGG